MKDIEVWDTNGHLFSEMKAIFSILPERARQSFWEVAAFEDADGSTQFMMASNGDDALSILLASGEQISGQAMFEIASTSPQVIWATFRGFDGENEVAPWIEVHAIDSSYWRVRTEDEATRGAVNAAFKNVRLSDE
jgi:hypothetical protein